MSKITLHGGTAPFTPAAGAVVLYAKSDGRFYYKNDSGTEIPLKPVGVGSGDLLSDGSVPLTSDWDVGSFSLTMKTITLDVADGFAPMSVTSTTVVPNLNVSALQGSVPADFATAAQGALADTAIQSADLGTAAAEDVGYFATAAQGATADTALQPADVGTAAAEDVGYFATAAQGALADTAVQPADLSNAALNKVITGTAYTILEADNGYNLIFTNAAAIAVTLPDTLTTNFQCSIIQTTAAGIPTVTPNTDTINGAATGVAPADQWKAMYLTQFAATEWLAVL